MARLIDLSGFEGGVSLEFEGSHIVFLLCMILVSVSILSMVIFACGDGTQEDQSSNKGGGGGCGGGGCGGGCGGG
ncbi:hypothetical protein R6Q59_019092 [Mikania micrantha]